MQLAAVAAELARLAWQHRYADHPPTIDAVFSPAEDHAFLHLDVTPLPAQPVRRLIDSLEETAVELVREAADAWHLMPVDGEQESVKLRATLQLPTDAMAPRRVDVRALRVDSAFTEATVRLFSEHNLDTLRLVHQLQKHRDQQEQLTQEIEETNRGVVALYAELEDQARQLQKFNATLEQRVAERTAEAEQRASQLRALASQLAQAEHSERRRIAQLLHDGLQQLIVASKMRLTMLQNQASEPAMRQSLAEIDELLSDMLQASRNLTIELAPPVLFQSNLKVALEWLASHMHKKHNLHVEVAGETAGAELSEDLRVLLFQATQELLFNVVKHAGTDSAEVQLTGSDETLEIAVVDRGRGFDPAAHRSSDASEQGGFGLFSVRERLGWYGGRFDVEATPGVGTTVRMTVASAQAAGSTESSNATPASTKHGSGRGPGTSDYVCRVLLVDDHRLVREGLRGLIDGQSDMQVVGEASDGREAVDLARRVKPHVVLMDVNLPGLGGVAAMREIIAHQPNVQVFAVSMHEAESVIEEVKAAGAADYISKEIAPESLCQIIRRAFTESSDDATPEAPEAPA